MRLFFIILFCSQIPCLGKGICEQVINKKSKVLNVFVEGKFSYSREVIPYFQKQVELGNADNLYQMSLEPLSIENSYKGFWYRDNMINEYKNLRNETRRGFHASDMTFNLLLRFAHEFKDQDIAHYPQRNSRKVVKCVEDMLESHHYDQIRVFSWSHGFKTAKKIANLIESRGELLTHFVSFDPVTKKVPKIFKGLFSNKNYDQDEKVSAERWINFYQKDDKRSLLVGIKGNSFPNARNIKIETDKSGHVTIFHHIFKDEVLLEELLRIF